MHIAAAGDRALLVTLEGAPAARLRAAAERLRTIDGVVAAIIGHESVYVVGTSDRDAVSSAVNEAGEASSTAVTTHAVEVSFAAEYALDFDVLRQRAGIDRDAIIARIAGLRLTVRYLGFRGGFAYLEGWPAEWSLPRRATSRNVVPGGSMGIAGVMAGFYPADLPGGWNIIGRTDRVPRMSPGDEVRIIPTDRALIFSNVARPPSAAMSDPLADILSPGQLTTVVTARDWSRAQLGESAGGPFDADAAAIANRAAGNLDEAPLLECVLVGPRLRFRHPCRVAFCGASCEPREWRVRAGEEIDIGRIRDGFRGYLAVAGGVSAFDKSLWSAGTPAGGAPRQRRRHVEDRLTIRIMPGPHDAPPLPQMWEATPNMNRVGVRLRPLEDAHVKPPAELPSLGVQFGTLQWHPDGSVIAMGPDHPVTGGYLQPATVISSDLWKLAQLAPGERLRLLPV